MKSRTGKLTNGFFWINFYDLGFKKIHVDVLQNKYYFLTKLSKRLFVSKVMAIEKIATKQYVRFLISQPSSM